MPHWVRDVFLGVLSNKKQKLVININSNEHFARGHVRDVGRCVVPLLCAVHCGGQVVQRSWKLISVICIHTSKWSTLRETCWKIMMIIMIRIITPIIGIDSSNN